MKQLDTLLEALIQLKDDSQDYSMVVEREADSLEKLSKDMTKLREEYSQIVELIRVSKKLLKISEVLTVQEQSLSLSLKQLELEEASEATPASSRVKLKNLQ